MKKLLALFLFVAGSSELPAATYILDGVSNTGQGPAPAVVEIINPVKDDPRSTERLIMRIPGQPEYVCEGMCNGETSVSWHDSVDPNTGETLDHFHWNGYWSTSSGYIQHNGNFSRWATGPNAGELDGPGFHNYTNYDSVSPPGFNDNYTLDILTVQEVLASATKAELDASGGTLPVPGAGTLTFDPSQIAAGEEVRVLSASAAVSLSGLASAGQPIQVEAPLGVTSFSFTPTQGDALALQLHPEGTYRLTSEDSFPWSILYLSGGSASVSAISWKDITTGFKQYVIVPYFTGQTCTYPSGSHWYWPAGKVAIHWFTSNQCEDDLQLVTDISDNFLDIYTDLVRIEDYDDPGPIAVHFVVGPDAPKFASANESGVYINKTWYLEQNFVEQFCVGTHEAQHHVTIAMTGWSIRNAFVESSAVAEEDNQPQCDFAQGPAQRYTWHPSVITKGLGENAEFVGDELYTGLSPFMQHTFSVREMAECYRTQAPAIYSRDYITAFSGCLNQTPFVLKRTFGAAAYRFATDQVFGWPQGSLNMPPLEPQPLTGIPSPMRVNTFTEYVNPSSKKVCLTVTVPADANPDLLFSLYKASDPVRATVRDLLLATDNKIYLKAPGNDRWEFGTYHFGITSSLGIPEGEQQEVQLSIEPTTGQDACEQ